MSVINVDEVLRRFDSLPVMANAVFSQFGEKEYLGCIQRIERLTIETTSGLAGGTYDLIRSEFQFWTGLLRGKLEEDREYAGRDALLKKVEENEKAVGEYHTRLSEGLKQLREWRVWFQQEGRRI